MPSRHPDFVQAKTIQLTADFISPAGRAWLANTSAARILHIFNRVCNLINADSELISVLASPVAMGPFAVRLNESINWSEMVSEEMPVHVHASSISIGAIQIDIEAAISWNPLPQWERLYDLKDSQPWLNEIRNQLGKHAPEGSIAQISSDEKVVGETKAYFVKARQAVLTMRRALRARDIPHMQQAAFTLAGLGPGLTPAGDDYLVGVMYGLWSTLSPADAARLSEALAKSAVPRTNNISRASLRAAANGEANADWHQLIQIISDAEVPKINLILTRIMNTGHTSGADALAGFVDSYSILAGEK